MKSLRSFLLLLLPVILLFFVSSCDDDDDDGAVATGEMSATIDGTQFTATQVGASRTTGSGGELIIVTGSAPNDNSQVLTLSFFNLPGTGQFTIGENNVGFATYSVGEGQDIKVFVTDASSAGTVTVSTLTNNRIAGTFNFEAIDGSGSTVTFTSGSFDAEIF